MSKRLVPLYAAALALFFNFIVPPFQNPDEIQHFSAVLVCALGSSRGPEIEERVIEQMDRYGWWRSVGMGRPANLPKRFADIPFLNLPGAGIMAGQPNLYYAAAARLMRFVPTEDTITLYYICRLFSAALFCGSLVLLAAAFFRTSGGFLLTAGWGIFFILFLPQFSVLSVSVNPETAAIFWGALFFYAVTGWISGGAGWPALAIVPVASLAGFLTDRSSFYLVPLALLLPLFSIRRGRPARSLTAAGLYLILTLAILSWAAWLFPGQIFSGLSTVKDYLLGTPAVPQGIASQAGGSWPNLLRFVDSIWLKFGWMAYSAGAVFYYVWRAAVALAILGMLLFAGRRLLRRSAGQSESSLTPRAGRLVALSVTAIAIQLAAILRTSFALHVPPQGRYLFPAIFPLAFLFVLGLESLGDVFGPRKGRILVSAFLIFEAAFFVVAVWGYVAPVFHLTLRAPHPGI